MKAKAKQAAVAKISQLTGVRLPTDSMLDVQVGCFAPLLLSLPMHIWHPSCYLLSVVGLHVCRRLGKLTVCSRVIQSRCSCLYMRCLSYSWSRCR